MRTSIIHSLVSLSLLAILATACSAPLTSGAGSAPLAAPLAAPAPTTTERRATPPPADVSLSLPAETRTDSAGSVAVEVTPAGTTSDTVAFKVVLNTHSVELDHDLTKIATLRDDQGRTYEVKDWNGDTGGHHRAGTLTFKTRGSQTVKWLELNLRGISGVPNRIFRWEAQ